MATLLSPRNDIREQPLRANHLPSDPTRLLESGFDHDQTFVLMEPERTLAQQARPVPGTGYLQLEGSDTSRKHPASYVRGVSLSGVLQMLHLERKTCVLEVTGAGAFGTLTLVNGELVDAETDNRSGLEAVCRILTWPEPQTMILDGVNLFRHTITMPISQILVESVRRQDEHHHGLGTVSTKKDTGELRLLSSPRQQGSDWAWLVETLIISGAVCAAVIDPRNETILAAADEEAGLSRGVSARRITQIAPFARAAKQWSHMVDTSVTELVLTIEGRQILVHPIDARAFVVAELGATGSIELLRSAIRSINR